MMIYDKYITMTEFSFSNEHELFYGYFDECILIDFYEIKNTNCIFITKETASSIIAHIKKIISKIELKINEVTIDIQKEYLNILIRIANAMIQVHQSYTFDTTVLTRDLELIKVTKYKNICGVNRGDYGVSGKKRFYDYLTYKEKLIETLSSTEVVKVTEVAEDQNILDERRKLVLQFEHPENYIDSDGDYDYDYIGNDIDKFELRCLVNAYNLRYKTRKHFIDINKIVYNYDDIKSKKLSLHNELKAYCKVFCRLIDIKYQIPVAISVNDK